jgi:hypothetical protein
MIRVWRARLATISSINGRSATLSRSMIDRPPMLITHTSGSERQIALHEEIGELARMVRQFVRQSRLTTEDGFTPLRTPATSAAARSMTR